MEKIVQVQNSSGIHASPSAMIVQTVMAYNATVALLHDGKMIDGRSILGILSLGLSQGEKVTLRAEGKDAEAVLEALEQLFHSEFK